MNRPKSIALTAAPIVALLACIGCSSGGSSSGSSPAPLTDDGPQVPVVVVRAEDCIDAHMPAGMDDTPPQQKLAESIRIGNAACVKYALQKGAQANEVIDLDLFPKGENMELPIFFALNPESIFFASSTQYIGVIQALVEAGADLGKENSDDSTPLQIALSDDVLAKSSNPAAYLLATKKANLEVVDRQGNTPLLDVMERGKQELATLLIKSGANVKAKTRGGRTTLQSAIGQRMEELALNVLNRGADADDVDPNSGKSALHGAAAANMKDLAHALLLKSVDVNRQDNDHETPLLLAIRAGGNQIVKELIAKGADVNLTSTTDGPIQAALRTNNDELISLLIPMVANINGVDSEKETPLLLAVRYASADQVQKIINRGANVNLAGPGNLTPLMLALKSGQPAKMNELVSVSNVNQRGPGGATAVFFATSLQDLQTLASHGADLNSNTDLGQTLIAQTIAQRQTDMALYLIKENVDLNWHSRPEKNSLLQSAVSLDNIAIVGELLARNADVNAVNAAGETPIFAIVSIPMLELLMKSSADINHLTPDKRSPLSVKFEEFLETGTNNSLAIVQQMVSHKANVNIRIFNRDTASFTTLLHLAVRAHGLKRDAQNAVTDLLLKAGAQVNARDSNLNTPLHLADSEGITQQLLSAGADRRITNMKNQTALQVHEETQSLISSDIELLNKQQGQLQDQLKKAPAGSDEENQLQQQLGAIKNSLNSTAAELNVIQNIIALLSA